MVFPQDPIGLRARLLVGGTWEDITEHVQVPVRITRGRQGATGPVRYGTCALTLLDPDGRYAPRNPLGRWFGQLTRNTDVEVSVLTDARWLDIAADSDTTATAGTAVDIAGDLDVRLDVACARWGDPAGELELVGRYNPFVTGGKGWALTVDSTGHLTVGWSPDGNGLALSGSAEPVPAGPGERITVRVTVDVDNGGGGSTITFYTGPGVDGPWTQLGDAQSGPPWAVHNPADVPLLVGDLRVFPAVGNHRRVYALQVRDGIDGTVVAAPDFTAPPLDTEAFTDSAGVPWALSSPIGRRVRFRGVIPAWPRQRRPRARARVQVTAAGIIRRLDQAPQSSDSVLLKAVRGAPATFAYWPLEDGADAEQAYSAVPGVQPLRVAGVQFAADDSLVSSGPLPTVQSGATMQASIPVSTTGEWRIEFVYRIPDGVFPSPGGSSQFLSFRTRSGVWTVRIGTTSVSVTVDNGQDTPYQFTDGNSVPLGEWARFYIQARQDGSNVAFEFGSMVIGESPTTAGDTFTGAVGHVVNIGTTFPFELAGIAVGHLSVSDAVDTTTYNGADSAYAAWNEDAQTRIGRLCTDDGTPVRLPWPGTAGVEKVGPQPPGRTLDLCRALADLDLGALYETRHAAALTYRPGYTLLNQPPAVTLAYADGSGIAEMTPVDDDQGVTNRVTVARQGGTREVAELPTGPLSVADIGEYPQSYTLNLADDARVADQAWWRLHIGTYDGARYPVLLIRLHEAPGVIPAVAALDTGDRVRVVEMPVDEEPDGADLLVQGYTEVLGVRTWEITYSCTPAGPWVVGVVDDGDVPGKADTDGTVLTDEVGADDTALTLTVTDGPLWTVDAAEYPFAVRLGGGEVATATGCVDLGGAQQSMTVVRGVNGVVRGWPAGADVRLANPMIVSYEGES